MIPFRSLFVATSLAAALAACSGPQSVTPVTQSLDQPYARTKKIAQVNDLLGQGTSAYYGPVAIASGPERDLWVAEDIDQDYGECAIVRVATSGKRLATYYYQGVTSEGASFIDLTKGPDGALWITDEYNEQILRMTTAGAYKRYPLPDGGFPGGIAVGRDRALWFTYTYGSKAGIGRITTSGKITLYTSGLSAGSDPYDIAAGPDGAMWFTEYTGDRIGRITTGGTVTEYSNGISSGSYPNSIVSGPDGALWFTEMKGGRIGRITTSGSVTEYSQGITAGEEPVGIAVGPHDTLWFTEYQIVNSYRVTASKIGRITTGGAITEYSRGITPNSGPIDIVEGFDGNMWFPEVFTDELGRVNL